MGADTPEGSMTVTNTSVTGRDMLSGCLMTLCTGTSKLVGERSDTQTRITKRYQISSGDIGREECIAERDSENE